MYVVWQQAISGLPANHHTRHWNVRKETKGELTFRKAKRYNTCKEAAQKQLQIWTNCKHAKKCWKNSWYQNILINTCKNEPGKPVFMRGSEGYSGNEESPFRALTHVPVKHQTFVFATCGNEESPFRALTPRSTAYSLVLWSVEMKRARLGRWHTI